MDQPEFRLEFNLQTMSMISLSAKLWDIPYIKTKIKNYFSKGKTSKPRWYEISKKVISYLHLLELPSKLVIKLERMIINIGEKIYDWVYHVTRVMRLSSVFTEKIYWTPYGTIDEVKIFDLYWVEIMTRPGVYCRSEYFNYHSTIFSLACTLFVPFLD